MNFEEQGYLLVHGFLDVEAIVELRHTLLSFHGQWLDKHRQHYEHGAINSAYITAPEMLDANQRLQLFELIASQKMLEAVASCGLAPAAFMNTQLFFDPLNPAQRNYWHRDQQYHLSLEDQQTSLRGPQVLHCRLATVAEAGVELVPGSHRRWDSDEELAVRTEQQGRHRYDDLPGTVSIALKAGDLLVFSASMIHRGLYGGDRLAFDILYCEPDAELLRWVEEPCLPTAEERARLENVALFERTLAVRHSAREQGLYDKESA